MNDFTPLDCPYCGADKTAILDLYETGLGYLRIMRCMKCGARGDTAMESEKEERYKRWKEINKIIVNYPTLISLLKEVYDYMVDVENYYPYMSESELMEKIERVLEENK